MEQDAQDELPEEFAIVCSRVERLIAVQEVERNERIQRDRVQQDQPRRANATRDHAVVAELMRKLDDTQ
jgi:hypothetical protein